MSRNPDASSLADWRRPPAALARHWSINVIKEEGASALVTVGGESRRIAAASSACDAPRNGRWPVSISNRMMPSENTSVR
jgi:hypothetical protein